jgi:type IV secretion system protein VirB6
MSGPFQIFAPAYVFVDGKLDQFLGGRLGDMLDQTSGPLRAALVLYVLLYGFAILRGAIAEPLMDFAVRSLKLALIVTLATTTAYSGYVTTPLFHGLPDTLAQAISGGGVQDVGGAFDQFFGRAAYLGQKIADTGSAVNLPPLLMAGAVYLVGALSAALGFGVVMVAKVALALIVALGPIFIACALFDASRRFFFGWLAQAVNYVVLFALIITIFQLILSLVASQWSAIDGQDPMAAGLLFIAVCLLAAIFFLQTPAIAAGIAGGASAGLADFAAAAAMGLRGAPPRFAAAATRGGATQAPKTGGSLRPLASKI